MREKDRPTHTHSRTTSSSNFALEPFACHFSFIYFTCISNSVSKWFPSCCWSTVYQQWAAVNAVWGRKNMLVLICLYCFMRTTLTNALRRTGTGQKWLQGRIGERKESHIRAKYFQECVALMKCAAAVYKWKLQTVVKRQLLTSCVRGNYTNGSVQKCSELLEKAVKCQNTKLGGANENNANEILFVDCFPWNKLQFLGINSVLEK